jgi:hypothetical protein
MNNIVTATEIKNYKDIGNKIDDKKDTNNWTSTLIDVKPLGDRFYFDLINNLSKKNINHY